ncbi:MAG: PQQ-binding-like beta-propeller repeat protein, partial [Myxococcales bacterium]|nr:PQQ-binding-like beta-propeller repeat protein [Myxococcales bacterium]
MLKQLRCPSCGAQLDPPAANAAEVTCAYCGVTAALERPDAPRRGEPGPRQGMPVAQYKTPRWAYVFYVLPFAGVVFGIGASLYGVATGQPPGLGGILQWNANAPLELIDVNGDGDLDVVGRVNTFERSEQVVHFAAYDGKSGDELWRTASFGTTSTEHSAKSRVIGDAVVAGDSRGQLHAFALADGQPRWKVSLGEQVDHLCPGDDGEAIVVTA